jgi:hypothetical protein
MSSPHGGDNLVVKSLVGQVIHVATPGGVCVCARPLKTRWVKNLSLAVCGSFFLLCPLAQHTCYPTGIFSNVFAWVSLGLCGVHTMRCIYASFFLSFELWKVHGYEITAGVWLIWFELRVFLCNFCCWACLLSFFFNLLTALDVSSIPHHTSGSKLLVKVCQVCNRSLILPSL